MALAISGRSARGASAAIVRRKSFFAPCSFEKGIFIIAVINLEDRCSLYHNALFQFVTRAMEARRVDHALRDIAAEDHSPVGMKENLRPRDGQRPLVIV